MNVISLGKSREVVSRTTKATSHSNFHSLAAKLLDVLFFVKHMTENSLFCQNLGRTGLQSNLQQSAFPDLFANGTTCFATSLELSRYIYVVCEIWDNYKPDDGVVAGNEENDEEIEDIKGPPDNLYAFDGIYN